MIKAIHRLLCFHGCWHFIGDAIENQSRNKFHYKDVMRPLYECCKCGHRSFVRYDRS